MSPTATIGHLAAHGSIAGLRLHLRKQLPHGAAVASPEKARLEATSGLDTCFNLDRCHSALGYHSPHQFE